MILAAAVHRLSDCTSPKPILGRICVRADSPTASRPHEILRIPPGAPPAPTGFAAYLFDCPPGVPTPEAAFALPAELHHLSEGDIVRIEPSRERLTTLFRLASDSNSLLVTERCDNRCIMCSQPPLDHDDACILKEVWRILPLISPETKELGITGGEPALLGQDLVELVRKLKSLLPRTAVHLLTNGRRFSSEPFARGLGEVQHPDLMVGVPLHSDLPEQHDYIAQRKGAFDETVRGILNLKRSGIRVEIRLVIHAQNRRRLTAFAEFVARNLTFVDHVALMGMEPVGFARANFGLVSSRPAEYQADLLMAGVRFRQAGCSFSVYNFPLCLLPVGLRSFARKSISDWKSFYPEGCCHCVRQHECGGFFSSGPAGEVEPVVPFRS
jgi:His-Xaa-Ser system radical SAM maturase HxsC